MASRHAHIRMPILVEQANALQVGMTTAFMLSLLLLGTLGFPRPGPVIAGVALAFWTVAIGFAIGPINPFAGYLKSWSVGWSGEDEETRLRTRRLLAACYDPPNRRRAVLMILATSVAFVLLWAVSRAIHPRPIGNPMRANEIIVAILVFGLPSSVFLGMFGATVGIRRNWIDIMTRGPEWSSLVPYPGPLKERFRSFITGEVSGLCVAKAPTT